MILEARQLPNTITVIRLILIIPFLIGLFFQSYKLAFYIFLLAGISDGIDGFLARYFSWTSQLGAFLDPLADKLLMMAAYLAMAWLNLLPVWLVAIVVGRDIIIMAGIFGLFRFLPIIVFKPSFISKINTVLQLLLILIVLFSLAYLSLPSWLIKSVMYTMIFTSLWSLFSYMIIWGHRAWMTGEK